MEYLLGITYRISRAAAWIGGLLILSAAMVVAVDVIFRKLFVVTLGGADELSGYAMAIGGAWAFAFALFHRAHIRIDSVYVLLPQGVRAALDILSLVIFTFFMVLVTRHAYGVMVQSAVAETRSLSRLGTPLVIPQALWVFGLGMFVIVCLLLLTRAILAMAGGDIGTVSRLIGSLSATEEIQQETDQLTQRRAPGRVD